MKIADLYIRVSTDEQADKGYSQRDQEERLRRFCQSNDIQVGKVILEDHSAKSFNRPSWIALMKDLRKRSNKTNLLLFTKWDRFSRNAGDAYQMLSELTKLGIELQAIEQPLDLSIPENKIMLAIYLAAPEVENDRRALNVYHGMRRAKREGRLMGKAPFGYINRSKEDGTKYIAVKELEAKALVWAFEEIAKGLLAANQIRLEMNKFSPRSLSKSAFHVAIRNPLYCGKIFIPKHKDEEAHFVDGLHEALITTELFDKVQEVLDGKVRKELPNTKVLSDENLPLRGFLVCPKCSRNLTGSLSKGRNNSYYYYHCIGSCGFRHSASKANLLFEEGLHQLQLNEAFLTRLKKHLLDTYNKILKDPIDHKKTLLNEIERLNAQLSMARTKLLSGTLDDEDYLEIKKSNKAELEVLETQLMKENSKVKIDINKILNKAIEVIANIGTLYAQADISMKRRIIGSIFPEKVVFDGEIYRTDRINVLVRSILLINNEIAENKNGRNEQKIQFSRLVLEAGLEPARALLPTGF
ncbi:recombinase family protein [Myroides odoratimimus]|nr:recombinase family protein [Myroides odoratimimus]